MIPQLSPEQLKRFRHWLVDCRFVSSSLQARKMTNSHINTHKTFLYFIDMAYEFEFFEEIADIAEVYIIE
jgi:hypothetical protein